MTTVMSPLSALLMTIDVSLRKSNRAFLSLGVRLSVVCCAFSRLKSCSISLQMQLSREVERRDAVCVFSYVCVPELSKITHKCIRVKFSWGGGGNK